MEKSQILRSIKISRKIKIKALTLRKNNGFLTYKYFPDMAVSIINLMNLINEYAKNMY